jgi:lipoate-protein ligase A
VGPLDQQTDLARSAIIDHLIATFQQLYGLTPGGITESERSAALALAETKFGTDEWIYTLP